MPNDKSDQLILRYPGLELLIKSGYGCLGAFLATIPAYFLFIRERGNIPLWDYTRGCFTFILLFYLLVLLPIELVVIHIFWRSFVFNRTHKTLTVSKYILFFRLGTAKKIPFSEIYGTELTHEYMVGSHCGAASGYVWWLTLNTSLGRFRIDNGLMKRGIQKKEIGIRAFLGLALSAGCKKSAVLQ